MAVSLLAAVLVLASCSDPPTPPECLDSDGDGFGDSGYGTDGCDDPTPDCNDGDHYVFPGADELCDGIDNDCDGVVPADEVDGDGDGISNCEGDCDDATSDAFPGAPELCDGIDNDCDGLVPDDENDQDEDGQRVCEGDCNDEDASVHTGAEEGCDDVDTDCDGHLGGDETDDDGDGVTECEGDCDDVNADVYSGAEELCDGLDTDCDGTLPDEETDGDGDGVSACAGDCDDDDPVIHPGALEACDGIDNDCDDALPYDELDTDADGQMECAGDCDDEEPTVYLGASELCDGLDNDCDGLVPEDEVDYDADGQRVCDGDCDDTEPTIGAGFPELCNGLDDDCDSAPGVDEVDGDADGMMICGGDCDDGNPDVYQGAPESCDGLDDNCNGVVPDDEADADADGFMVCEGDCDDGDPDNFLNNIETCDGADNDCDGAADNGLPDCGPPEIGGMDGDSDDLSIVDYANLLDGIGPRTDAQHRFEESWIVTGQHLDIVDSYLMEQTQGGSAVFTAADGLVFQVGGSPTQRILLLPAALAEGYYELTLTNPAGQVTMDVFVLRGEPGERGEDMLDCGGPDCSLGVDLTIQGDLAAVNLTLEDGATVDGTATFGTLETTDLAVSESIDLGPCPGGYAQDDAETQFTLCERMDASDDEVVAVGDFWIDRYELSLWSEAGCTGTQYGATGDDADGAGFDYDGNWTTPLYACSVANELPSRWITWYQAQQACALSGKLLCTNAQWQAAAAGTPDDTTCNIDHGVAENTGFNTDCESTWGAMDMVGNMQEWVSDWQGHAGSNGDDNLLVADWGADMYHAGGPAAGVMPDHGNDNSWRARGGALEGYGLAQGDPYGPAAILRGGYWDNVATAGIFAMRTTHGPSSSNDNFGARCCMER